MMANKFLRLLLTIFLLFILPNISTAGVATYSVHNPFITLRHYAVGGPVNALTYGGPVDFYRSHQQPLTYYSAVAPLSAATTYYVAPQPFVKSLQSDNSFISDVAPTTLTKSVMATEPDRDLKTSVSTPPLVAVASATAAAIVPVSRQAVEVDDSSSSFAVPSFPSSSSSSSAIYDFSYRVHDSITGDIKSQVETRHGGNVQGAYSVLDADGYKRTVTYRADDLNGFNAVVQREPVVAELTDVADVIEAGRASASSGPVQHFQFISQSSVQQVPFGQQQYKPQSILPQRPAAVVAQQQQQQQEYQPTYPQNQQLPPQYQQLGQSGNQQNQQQPAHQQQQQQEQSNEGVSSATNFDDTDVLEARFATEIDDQKTYHEIQKSSKEQQQQQQPQKH